MREEVNKMNNMIIKDEDLYSKNSPIVQLLNDLEQKEQELRRQADRVYNLNLYIVRAVKDKRITNMKDVYDIVHWLDSTDLEPIDILRAFNKY